jgi:hypothetical protein
MTFQSWKLILLASWTVTVLLVAFGTGIHSTTAWAAIIAMALIPPAVAMQVWNPPAQTTSQSIKEAQR